MVKRDSRGRLFVFSGPSGAGKGTVRKELFRRVEGLVFSISCTTRTPRQGEIDGVDYRFIGQKEFKRRIAAGDFLEWAEVHGNMYGTLCSDVERYLDEGKDVVLEIDVQGTLQVKDRCPDIVTVFLTPPSTEELERRLRRRGSEDEQTIKLRLNNALEEMALAVRYDHIVVNDELQRAVSELEQIVYDYREGRGKRRG